MKKLLIVSNYYPPEKGAAANRIGQMAAELKKRGYRVRVICPMPNYPDGVIQNNYQGRFYRREVLQDIKVERLWIYPSKSKKIRERILSTLSFSSLMFLRLLFGPLPKTVVVQSPPLLLSFLAVLALTIRQKRIILNVSDLWPLAAIELGALEPGTRKHRIALFMERFIYKRAKIVLGQSQEIIDHVRQVVPGKRCHLYRNYPVKDNSFTFKPGEPAIKLFYAGLLGVAQGVLDCIKLMDLFPTKIEMHIFGQGPDSEPIREYLASHPEKNIAYHGMVDRKTLHAMLQTFDIAFVPLATRIYGSVPSKIFEYTALGMPVLYFGGGEGENIVANYNLGFVAPVGDFKALNAALMDIANLGKDQLVAMRKSIKETSDMHFSLDRQMDQLMAEGVF